MLKVELEDGELVCYSGETRLGSLADVIDKLYGKLILLLELDDANRIGYHTVKHGIGKNGDGGKQ